MSGAATDIAILRDDIDTLVARMGEIEITTDADNAKSVFVHACVRPLLTAWRALRLMYRIAATPPKNSLALEGEAP